MFNCVLTLAANQTFKRQQLNSGMKMNIDWVCFGFFFFLTIINRCHVFFYFFFHSGITQGSKRKKKYTAIINVAISFSGTSFSLLSPTPCRPVFLLLLPWRACMPYKHTCHSRSTCLRNNTQTTGCSVGKAISLCCWPELRVRPPIAGSQDGDRTTL